VSHRRQRGTASAESLASHGVLLFVCFVSGSGHVVVPLPDGGHFDDHFKALHHTALWLMHTFALTQLQLCQQLKTNSAQTEHKECTIVHNSAQQCTNSAQTENKQCT